LSYLEAIADEWERDLEGEGTDAEERLDAHRLTRGGPEVKKFLNVET